MNASRRALLVPIMIGLISGCIPPPDDGCHDDDSCGPPPCTPTTVAAQEVAPGVMYYDCTQTTRHVHVVTIERETADYELRLLYDPLVCLPWELPPPGFELLLSLTTVNSLAKDNAIVAINGGGWAGHTGDRNPKNIDNVFIAGTPLATTFDNFRQITANTHNDTEYCDETKFSTFNCHPDLDGSGCCPEAQMGFAPNTAGRLDVQRFPFPDSSNVVDKHPDPASRYGDRRYTLYGSNSTLLAGGQCQPFSIKDYWSIVGYSDPPPEHPEKAGQIILLTTQDEYDPKADLCQVLLDFKATEAVMQDGGGSAQMYLGGNLSRRIEPASESFFGSLRGLRKVAYAIGLVDRSAGHASDRCSPPSCNGLASTCGPSGNESCCVSPVVPGGTYNRSNDPAYPATVSDFRLDRFEVTVGRFRAFVQAYPWSKPLAGCGVHPKIPGSGWNTDWNTKLPVNQAELMAAVKCHWGDPLYDTWTDTAGPNENRPMNCLDWYLAFAFCAWDGGRLPTEAEWNYAAAGGSEQREYPWSSPASDKTIDPNYAVYFCTGDGSPEGCTFDGTSPADILKVGSKPNGDGKWGQADLGGSMWEWNMDGRDVWASPYPGPCTNCADGIGAQTALAALRGGGWPSPPPSLLSSDRNASLKSDRTGAFGVRCARTP